MYLTDNRFLNSMAPVNHIFLFRSNIDMLNKRTMLSANSTQESDTSDAGQSEAEASDTKESTEIKQPPPFIKTSYPVHLIDCPAESETNVFSSRPPDKPSDPGVTCTGKRSGNNESQSVEEDFWIKELCLKLSDKRILEKGHWVNDRIIMAVFKILRLVSMTALLTLIERVRRSAIQSMLSSVSAE